MREKKQKKSGNYGDFSSHVDRKEWLVFYHKRLIDLGDTDLQNAAHEELPAKAFLFSEKRTTSISPVSGGIASIHKEEMDQRKITTYAILQKNYNMAQLSRTDNQFKQEMRLEGLTSEVEKC